MIHRQFRLSIASKWLSSQQTCQRPSNASIDSECYDFGPDTVLILNHHGIDKGDAKSAGSHPNVANGSCRYNVMPQARASMNSLHGTLCSIVNVQESKVLGWIVRGGSKREEEWQVMIVVKTSIALQRV
jgi:hypothetical protein